MESPLGALLLLEADISSCFHPSSHSHLGPDASRAHTLFFPALKVLHLAGEAVKKQVIPLCVNLPRVHSDMRERGASFSSDAIPSLTRPLVWHIWQPGLLNKCS